MELSKIFQTLLLVLLIAVEGVALAQSDSDTANDWPRQFSADGLNFTIYQPQVEKWQGTDLEARSAVSVQTPSSSEPVFGVVWIKARTDVDKSQRLVALNDVQITKVNFPTETGKEDDYKSSIEKNASNVLGTISLDRLRASLSINASEAKHKVAGLKNDPPEILYAEKPTILVLLDGPGAQRSTGLPNLLRVVNTRALIVFNQADGKYNLNVGDQWYQATELKGPWTAADLKGTLLDNLNMLKHENADEIDTFDKSPDKVDVVVSTDPAELVQTKGNPQFEPIQGTELLYVTNTPNNIFLNTSDQSYFVTLSGRWFKSKSLRGPWKFIESDKLPADFAKIPETHPKGEVLASVAGTPDAKEAEIANEIPQTATVDRDTATIKVVYDGAPRFAPISGSVLQYASNSATPVIKISDNSYYAVSNGVWFTATTPQGPWTVASDVPQVIYTIPPASPVYYVTYVYVYGANRHYVYAGYLPGYLGSYVAPTGVVVYGTGYYYRPWVGTYWYGYPATYGFGFAWGFGFGWAFRPAFYGAPVYRPWWGPWPHYWAHGPYAYRPLTVNHINIYHTWDRNVVRASVVRNVHTDVPTRTVPHMAHTNNVYADHSGNIFRHEKEQGWQQLQKKQWRNETSPAKDLERERVARERGAVKTERYRPEPSAPAKMPKPARRASKRR